MKLATIKNQVSAGGVIFRNDRETPEIALIPLGGGRSGVFPRG